MLEIKMKLFRRKNGYWYVRFERGKEKSLRTKDKRLAQKLFREIQQEALKGRLILLEKQKNISLEDFLNEYLSWAENHKSALTVDRDRWVFKRFYEYMGNRSLRSISVQLLEAYQAFLLKRGRKPAGVNLDFRHLKAAFNKALEWGYIKSNPFSRIKLLKIPQKTPRFISQDEMARILDYLKERDLEFHDFVLVVLETGCRRNEILFLTAQDVNLEVGFIRVLGKGHKERIIPMTDNVKEILYKRIHKPGRLFDRWTPNWVSHKWNEVMKKLGLNYRFHDLRHTTASWLAIKGIPIQVIQELLGHTNINITQIYAHLRPDVIKKALEEVFGCKNAGNFQAAAPLKLVK